MKTIYNFDPSDEIKDRPALKVIVRFEHSLDIEFHRFRRKVRTVMKLHAVTKLECINQPILAHFIRFGKLRNWFEIFVETIKPFVERLCDSARQQVGRLIRI